ncbi:MAG: M24 family metallopeptidase [Gammaproteobacteria bacterium]
MQPGAKIDLARMRRGRRQRLLAAMTDQGLDALVLLGQSNQEYAGITRPLSDAMRVHYEPNVVLLSSAGELNVWTWYPEGALDVPAANVHRGIALEMDAGPLLEAIGALLPDARRIGIDELTAPLIDALGRLAPRVQFVDAAPATVPARLIKTADEIACLRVAQSITETAMVDVAAALRPGVRQTELSAVFFRRVFELGITWSCVDPIWNVTPRSTAAGASTTHGGVGFPLTADDRFIRDGDLIMTDVGLVWNGYHSDFGKTWLCGFDARPDPKLQRCFDRWRTLIDAVYAAIRPGRTCADVARDARRIEPVFSVEHFYLGHGTGCDAAELPFIGSELGPAFEDTVVLTPGMTIVLEPVIWEDGVGGYRSEEMVVVTQDGCERLSSYGYAPFE